MGLSSLFLFLFFSSLLLSSDLLLLLFFSRFLSSDLDCDDVIGVIVMELDKVGDDAVVKGIISMPERLSVFPLFC